MKKAIATLILTLGLTVSAAQAQELPNLKLKSTTTAWILGLDPIPGDGLFYADKPVQGAINMALGLPSAFFFYTGVAMMATADRDNPDDWSALGGAVLMFCAGIPYAATLLWDGIGGIHGVYAHNAKVQERSTSLWQRIQPSVAVTNDGAFGSVSLKF